MREPFICTKLVNSISVSRASNLKYYPLNIRGILNSFRFVSTNSIIQEEISPTQWLTGVGDLFFADRPSWTLRQRCWRTLQHCRRSRRTAPTPHIPAQARPIPRNRRSSSPPRTRRQRTTRSRLDRHPGTRYRPGSPTSGYDRLISWSASAS